MASTFVGGSDEDGVNISAVFTQTSSLKYNYADDSRGDIMLDVGWELLYIFLHKINQLSGNSRCISNVISRWCTRWLCI
jgi:hypothetical protein